MKTIIEVMYLFRGAYIGLLLLGLFQYCIHDRASRGDRMKRYHKATFLIGLLRGWIAVMELYWYVIEFMGLDVEPFFQTLYGILLVPVPSFVYLTSYTLRFDTFSSTKLILLNSLPTLIPILFILTGWDFLYWLGMGYCTLLFGFTYVRHNWWQAKHRDLLKHSYSNLSGHTTRWFNNAIILFLVQTFCWEYYRLTDEPMVNIVYMIVAIVIYSIIVYMASKQSDHLLLTQAIQESHANEDTKEERPVKLSDELIANISKQLSKTEQELLYLQNDIDVNEYCRRIGTNHSYFSRYLNQEKGMTFYQYINSRRMIHVQELILNTKLSIEEIALQCGYNDSRSFRRAFKESFHVTPSEYRDRYK